MMLPAITEVLPHRGGMLLLEALLRYDSEGLTASATPDAAAWYADADGNMPAYIGIELMAQAVAAWVGLTARQAGQPVKQGVLLGTRRYQPACAAFAAGRPLRVSASPVYRDESGMGSFLCRIDCGEDRLAEATVNVFEPEDFALFLQESSAQ